MIGIITAIVGVVYSIVKCVLVILDIFCALKYLRSN